MASFRQGGPTERFEKRKHFRFAVQLPVELGHRPDDMTSICTNLSWQGVSVETAQELTIGERLSVAVTIAPKEEPLRMLGQVVWRREMGVVGIEAEPIREIGIRFLRPLPSPWQTPEEPELEFDPAMEEEVPNIIPFRKSW